MLPQETDMREAYTFVAAVCARIFATSHASLRRHFHKEVEGWADGLGPRLLLGRGL